MDLWRAGAGRVPGECRASAGRELGEYRASARRAADPDRVGQKIRCVNLPSLVVNPNGWFFIVDFYSEYDSIWNLGINCACQLLDFSAYSPAKKHALKTIVLIEDERSH